MNAHEVPLLWCLLQVTLLSSLGVGAAWLMTRRAPAGGAIATAAAAATIAAVTLLTPVSLPKLSGWPTPSVEQVGAESVLTGTSNHASAASMGGFSFDVGAVLERMLSARQLARFVEPVGGPRVEWFVGAFATAGAAVGLLRLWQSLQFVTQIRRGRTLIIDCEIKRLFASLSQSLGVRRSVELCESPLIASPAVIGWRRPTVLLPIERAGWTERQLRAALAHELAHVVRGDFFWRFIGSVTLAVHFFHPLVHLLTRRLTLLQELATDRLASTAFGDSTHYLRALSELAIRLDEHSRFRAERIVLPALSSNLTRRITMLRSTEGSAAAERRRFGGVVAAGLIAMIGVGTMAMRGAAEEYERAPEAASTAGALFSREALAPAVIGTSEEGLLVVRLAELAQRPALMPVLELLINEAKESWISLLPGTSPPAINLECIEYVAASPALKMRPKTGDAPDEMGMVTIGGEELIIGLKRETPWREWILKNVPGAEEVTEEGFVFVKLPEITQLGPARLCVAARDSRTLVVTAGVDRLRQSAQGPRPEGTTPLAGSWGALDGGLASVLYKIDLDKSTVPPGDFGAQMMIQVLENAKQVGAGFDFDVASNQSGIRINVTCVDRESAERVRGVVQSCLPVARMYFQNAIVNPPQVVFADETEREHWTMTAGTPETDRMVAQWYLDLVASCSVRLEPRDDGMVDVRIEGQAQFPTSILTAYERSDEDASRK